MNMLKYFITVAYASGGGGKRMGKNEKNDMAKDYRKMKRQVGAVKDLADKGIDGVKKVVRFVVKLITRL